MMLGITFTCVLIDLIVVSCLASPHSTQYNSSITENSRIRTSISEDNIALKVNYTESKKLIQPRMRRAANDSIETGNKTSFEAMSLINEIITKNKNDVIAALDKFIYSIGVQSFAQNVSKVVCTVEQYDYSGLFRESLKKWLISLINGRRSMLSSIHIVETSNMNGVLSDKINISDFILKDIKIKGLENVTLLEYNMDLCEKSTEIEFKVPNLEITALYTLKGIIDGNSVVGDGNLRANINGLYFYDRSFPKCSIQHCPPDNKTLVVTTVNVEVNATGVKYRDWDELMINEAINKYVKYRIKETLLKPRIQEKLITLSQERPLMDLLPLVNGLREDLNEFSIPMDRPPRCLDELYSSKIMKTFYNFFINN